MLIRLYFYSASQYSVIHLPSDGSNLSNIALNNAVMQLMSVHSGHRDISAILDPSNHFGAGSDDVRAALPVPATPFCSHQFPDSYRSDDDSNSSDECDGFPRNTAGGGLRYVGTINILLGGRGCWTLRRPVLLRNLVRTVSGTAAVALILPVLHPEALGTAYLASHGSRTCIGKKPK